MRSTVTLLLMSLCAFIVLSCNSGKEESSNTTFTATINDESWEFFDVTASRNGEDVEIKGKGYLEGDRGAVPLNLTLVIVALPGPDEIKTPLTAHFTPGTLETAAYAIINPTDENFVFDTKLDANTGGTLLIKEKGDRLVSGEFSFIAADPSGRQLEVKDGKFTNLQLQ